ncbi:hypothetical protein C5167_034633 [Papaver somniferum]|uniref:SHSP domain-containing protein n=1 Tax=Papaver somniferum TaxID=3469 RepID=A0A4Y7KGH9_PAPSO|nr:hypothetical protein C5167_034633 [Papaver somniferum]
MASVVAKVMRGTIKRVNTPFNLHRQMSVMVNKRSMSSSSIDSSPGTCSSTKYKFTDHFPDSVVNQNDPPTTKNTTDADWLQVDMRTKNQTKSVPQSGYGGKAPSSTKSGSYGDDEITEIQRKMDYMPMFKWNGTSYGFCDGCADEDSDGMYVKMLVPDLGKEDIKQVQVEQKLVAVGESPDVSRTLKMTMIVEVLHEKGDVKKYSTPFFVKPENYEFSNVSAKVHHGVLRIFIPKVKPAKIEDRIFDVNLEQLS